MQVTAFPREALKLVRLDSYIDRYNHPVPQARLGRSAWSLEGSETDDLHGEDSPGWDTAH